MAYEFVCESEAKRYRSDCSNVLKETCELLKEKGISAQFSLVGSGARNMITRNGNGPYDLDYNLLVMKADNEYRDPRLLKDTIRNALNKAVGGKFFSDAQDSTSCLTAILYFEKSPDIKFKFDRMRHYVAMSIYLMAAFSIVMTIGFSLANKPILHLMNSPEEVFGDVTAYMGIIYAGLIITGAYNALAAFLRALGDSKSPLYFLIITIKPFTYPLIVVFE